MFGNAQRLDHPRKLRHLGKVLFHRRGYRRGCGAIVMPVTRQDKIGRDPVNIAGIFMMPVIAELILYIYDNVQTAQRADGQAENIDKAESPVLYQEPVSRFEIVFEHAGAFIRSPHPRKCRFSIHVKIK
jgi:hypothetical protein